MSNRICRVFISNEGTGTLKLIEQGRDHGEWIEGWSPFQTAQTIGPGEKRRFESAESDDIPILGSIATGNQGWALYETSCTSGTFGSSETAFVKIVWNLPYLPNMEKFVNPFDVFPHNIGCWLEITKFDPRIDVASGEFDDRDFTPSNLKFEQFAGANPGGDSWTDTWGEIPLIIAIPPIVLADANLGINAMFTFLNTVKPEESTMPAFSSPGSRPKAIPKPMINTNPSMWTGVWNGDRMSLKIIQRHDGRLDIAVWDHQLERDYGPYQTVSVNRAYAQIKNLKPNQLSPSPAHLQIEHEILIEEGIGTPERRRLSITSTDQGFARMDDRFSEIVSSLRIGRIPIGGDFVRLAPDTLLELCQMVSGKDWVDTTIHLRQPLSFPNFLNVAQVDELLYYEPQLH